MKHPLRILVSGLILTVCCESAVQAQDSTSKNFRRFTVTFAPAYLAFPVYELTGEYVATRHLGFAVKGGYGGFNGSDFGFTDDYNVTEAGAQVRYYPFEPASHQFMVGGEVHWLDVSSSTSRAGASSAGSGFIVGPFVGYKYISPFGLTFDSQIGYGFFALNTSVDGSSVWDGVLGIPIVNLNIGWSFGGG